jgi:Bacterial toxin YdaS
LRELIEDLWPELVHKLPPRNPPGLIMQAKPENKISGPKNVGFADVEPHRNDFHVPSLSTRINMSREALTRAIKIAGGYRALARAAGVSHQSVMKWKRVPPRRVLAVEELTGIPRHVLRPDIYPPSREPRGRR